MNSSRVYLEYFVNEAANSLSPGSLVLDAGAGHAPYRGLFDHVQYETADFCQVEDTNYYDITYICDLTSIPVDQDRYDLILCTQVLEHVPDPQKVLNELHRILKPGCELWISAPLFFPEHQIPHDYYRYTQYGFRHLLQKSGFKINRLEPLEGFYGTLSFQFARAATVLPLSPKHYGSGVVGFLSVALTLILKPLLGVLSIYFSRLDIRYKNNIVGYCKNYAVVAKKPD